MKKAILASVLGLALALVAAAFLFLNPFGGSASAEDLIGSWRGDQGAQLILNGDGSLKAVKVPTNFSIEGGAPVDPFTGSGKWSLQKKANLVDQEIEVTLGEADGAKTGIRLRIMGEGAGDGIYIPISEDSPKKFKFTKTP
ncbi:hypothetical protein GCM10010495_55960 [Kitasatospora herbaricolor]|uniref:hypothetical protein n=1 Tax=Kitasatospora herbaricolor TaxID=68217 RepID=UPI00174B4F6E|nr:hypothetical protein [Kitasatospora herbaricolor]MDQ0311002.1 hypothetical protein [Kitasatospora herbaricolor]GGV32070.1 hypothetical protein GCM10010495_55960 [Kitasatospora herbaricolor]